MSSHNQATGLTTVGKLRLAFLTVLLTILAGTLGFIYLEDMSLVEGLYMTVITLSTVGFSEVRELHDTSRLFVILLISFGVLQFGMIATLLGQSMLEGHFRELVSRRKMEQRRKKMKDHFIIAGFGRVGRQVAREFARREVPFVVLEKDNCGVEHCSQEGYSYVQGDATDEETLQQARIERARTLISTLPDEAHNVYLTLTARHMCPDLNIIARADFEEGEKKLMRAGANHVVIPHVLGGIRMAMASLQPHVVDFMQMTSMGEEGVIVEELQVPEGSFLAGKTLVESTLKSDYGVTIIGVKSGQSRLDINPEPETRLKGGDIMLLIGRVSGLERLSQDIRR